MKNLVLYGAGGFGREIAAMIQHINRISPTYEFLGFVDDSLEKHGKFVAGYPVLGGADWVIAHKEDALCTCTIGVQPKLRESIQEGLEEKGVSFETLIAPGVKFNKSVTIGQGSIIDYNNYLSIDVKIGKGVVVNSLVCIGHDVVVDDYSCIMTRATLSGNVHIGKRVMMGGSAYLVPGIKVGDDAVVAAGSVVFHKVKAGTHVLGNPARRIEL